MEKNGESRNVAVIGLGLMGSALAENFLKADHAVTVWNRSLAKTEPFAAKGARVATSPSDAILASDVAVVCVPDHATTLALLEDLESPVEGKTLVQVSTMTSQESNELAIWGIARLRIPRGLHLRRPHERSCRASDPDLCRPQDAF